MVQVQYRPLFDPGKHSVSGVFYVIRFEPFARDTIGDEISAVGFEVSDATRSVE